MSLAFSSFAALMLIAMLVGAIMGIFFRGRRRQGWKMLGVSFLAFVVSVTAATFTLDRGTSEPTVVAATAPVAQDFAPPVSETSPETEAASSVAEQFGDEAVSAYCDGYHETIRIIREADTKFGIEGTDEKLEWIKERDAATYASTEAQIGAPYTEWQPVATEQHWDQRCEGLARGWLLIEIADLSAADAGDARVVARTLQVVYEDKIAIGDELPFSRYRSASCEEKGLEGYRFVGCKLTGGQGARQSDPYIYFAGHRDGASVIVPFDNDARDHMTEVSYLDRDPEQTVTPVGWYVGPRPFPVPYRNIRALFE